MVSGGALGECNTKLNPRCLPDCMFWNAGSTDVEACMRVSKAVEQVLGVNEDPKTQVQHLQVRLLR